MLYPKATDKPGGYVFPEHLCWVAGSEQAQAALWQQQLLQLLLDFQLTAKTTHLDSEIESKGSPQFQLRVGIILEGPVLLLRETIPGLL